jgi:hypothetical protein
VTQSLGFSGRVMPLIVVEAAHQNRQLGAELATSSTVSRSRKACNTAASAR